MKSVAFNADESVAHAAEERARREHTTLEAEFRRWLSEYARCESPSERAMRVIRDLQEKVDTSGQKFTRDEINER